MKTASKAFALASTVVLLSGCFGYEPKGPEPEAKKSEVKPQWTDADVASVVDVTYESIPALTPVEGDQVPAACQQVKFLRFTPKDLNGDARAADAAMLFVPGVLEGANGFEYIGRQLVYMAKTQRNANIEVWALDRRSNCFEDITGFEAAEHAATVAEAEDLLLGYYYEGLSIGGRSFEGFYSSEDIPALSQFGIEQTTSDMYAVIQHFFPNAAESRQKVFVGGHSLGGTHTSVFLAWDQDGNAATQDDVGANMVAGAIGFDTFVGSVAQALPGMEETAPLIDMSGMWSSAEAAQEEPDSDSTYQTLVEWLEDGSLPNHVDIPGVFTAEAIALPEAVGVLAAKAPDAEATVIARVPQSPAVKTLFRFFHTRDANNYAYGPYIESFRYTNEATVGLMFDDHFSILSFLQTSLGHMHGGAVVEKAPVFDWMRDAPMVGPLIKAVNGNKTQHIAADAGPSRFALGQGPLYTWTSMDEIGRFWDQKYRSTDGSLIYTTVEEEMVRMEDFTRALHIGPTNLTEWYFPLRIMIDVSVVNKSFAPDYGINTLHRDAYLDIPTLLLVAKDGMFDMFDTEAEAEQRPLQVIELPGMSHLDPMFATVNTPSMHKNQVADNLLDFVFANVK